MTSLNQKISTLNTRVDDIAIGSVDIESIANLQEALDAKQDKISTAESGSSTQVCTNVINVFPSNGSTTVVLANSIPVYGGTLIVHFTLGGYSKSTGKVIILLNIQSTSGTTLKTMTAPFSFNRTSVHSAWSRTEVFTGIPAQNVKVVVQRVTGTTALIRSDWNDFFSVSIQEMPY